MPRPSAVLLLSLSGLALSFAPSAAAECIGLPEACVGVDGGPAGDAYACASDSCVGADVSVGSLSCDPVENPRCITRIQYEPAGDTLCVVTGPRDGSDPHRECFF